MQSNQSGLRLDGKVSIITGAGSGIGKAIAILYASHGSKVVVSDVDEQRIKETVEEIKELGGSTIGVKCDICKQSDIDQLFEETETSFGSVDILVNNAGIMDNFVPCEDILDEVWEKVFAVNTTAPMRTMRKAIPIFLEKKKGVIVNLASIGGLHGSRAGTAYTASKHAVVGLTKNVGFQYGKQGIRCNAIAPGAVKTNIEIKTPHPLGLEKAHSGMVLLPRAAEALEIANVALFLASDDASYINGSVISVDGGWTAY